MGPIIRETVEAVVYDLVVVSEQSGVPSGERIDQTVEEVLGDLDLDSDPHEEREPSRTGSSTRSTSATSGPSTNGHGEETTLGDALRDLDAQTQTNGSGRP